MAGTLEIRLLGGVQLVSSGATVPVTGTRRRTLLALLALRCGEPVSTDFLIDVLWGEAADASSLHNLRANVSNLRKSLGDHAEALTTRTSAYVLDLDPDTVDVLRFERLAASGRAAIRRGEHAAGVDQLHRALAEWRGDPLVDLLGADVMDREADRLRHVHLATFEDWIDGALALGRHAEVLDDLAPMVEANPLREHLTASYMLALYRSGRQADALRRYAQTREHLANELGIDPGPELRELETAILLHDPSLTLPGDDGPMEPPGATGPALRPQLDGLPADPDDLVDRQELIDDVVDALDREPLVTLWGPGGVGKTRVGVRVARRWRGADATTDPVHFVDLAAVEPSGPVGDALLAAVGAQPWAGESEVDAVGRVLRPSRALVVMDNCEHVLPTVRLLVAALLTACPDLRLLLTSRETLGLPTETAVPVTPLATPGDSDRADALVATDAVRLFVARAAAVKRGFAVDDHNASAVSTLVRSLGGLPLAIELAAGRLDVEPIEELAADTTGGLLARLQHPDSRSEREGSVASSIAWSYDALSASEQELLQALSIFAGAFTRDQALQVHGRDDGDTHADFDHLVRSSLVSGDPTVSARFRLLAPVRAFVRDRVGARGSSLRARHAHVMLERTERFAPLVRTDQQAHACAVFRADFADVRQAMSTLMDPDVGDPDAAARMLVAAFQFCHFQVIPEVNGWAAAIAESLPPDHPQAADTLGAAALAAWFEGRMDRAIELGERSVTVAEASGRQAPYWSRLALVDAYGFGGAHEQVFPHFTALVRDSRQDPDPFWRINGMGYEVIGALMMGRLDRAEQRAGDALQASRDLGNPECLQWALHVFGRAISGSDQAAAAAAFEEAMASVATVDSRLGRSLNLSEWVTVKRQAGAVADAAAGLVELLGLLRSTGIRSLLSTALRECAYVLHAAGDDDAAAAALLARTDLPDMPVLADDQSELRAALEAASGDRWPRLALQARVRPTDAVISLCIDALERVSDA